MIEGVAWEDLAVLLAALDQGSLSKAAAQLRVGQSTASRRLVRLEQRLGASLFDRVPEGLRPTALAWEIEPHARLIAERMLDIDRVVQGQEGSPTGRVRLAVVDGLAGHWLTSRLPALLDAHPGLQLDLIGGQAVVDLVRREADLAARFVRPTAPDLVCVSLGTVRIAPYVHPSLLGRELRWLALHDPREILQETAWLEQHVPEPAVRVGAWSDLFAAARHGVGAALLALQAAEPAGLVRVPGLPDAPPRELLLVYHAALRQVPRIAVVREWLVAAAREFL